MSGRKRGTVWVACTNAVKIWWLKYHFHGKPVRESSKSQKKMEAKALLAQREGDISSGKIPGIHLDRVTFDELADDLLTDYRVNGKKSLDRAELSVKHLSDFFGGYKVISITTPRIKKYIQQRKDEGAANATINRELSALKRMFNLAAKCVPPKMVQIPHVPMLKENNTAKGIL